MYNGTWFHRFFDEVFKSLTINTTKGIADTHVEDDSDDEITKSTHLIGLEVVDQAEYEEQRINYKSQEYDNNP